MTKLTLHISCMFLRTLPLQPVVEMSFLFLWSSQGFHFRMLSSTNTCLAHLSLILAVDLHA